MTPKEAIAATVASWGGRNPAALIRIAERESRLTPTARGDAAYAPAAYERVRDDLRKMGNPWADDPSRWSHSFGLYQMMPAYYARLWSPTADPHVLFDPRIATVVAARLWNRALQKGATDFVRVRLFWANPSWVNIPSDDSRYQDRLDKWSIVDGQLNPPVRYFDYSAFGTGPQQGQESRLPADSGLPPASGGGMGILQMLSLGWLGFRLWKAYVKPRKS